MRVTYTCCRTSASISAGQHFPFGRLCIPALDVPLPLSTRCPSPSRRASRRYRLAHASSLGSGNKRKVFFLILCSPQFSSHCLSRCQHWMCCYFHLIFRILNIYFCVCSSPLFLSPFPSSTDIISYHHHNQHQHYHHPNQHHHYHHHYHSHYHYYHHNHQYHQLY